MLGVTFDAGAVHVRDDLPEPQPVPGETRVEVIAAGVCATDLALARGYMGFSGVPGHEFVGRALDGPLAGTRVVGEINAGCGTCDLCATGDPRHCNRRTVLGILGRPGAFAERLSLPTVNLHAVPDNVSDAAAVLAEPLAAAWHVTEQLDVARHRRVLVAGDGRLGLLCAHALHLAGAEVAVAGRHAERAALLPAGVPHLTGLLEANAPAASERSFDAAVEATGHADVLPRVCAHVRPRGTIVLKTTSELPLAFDTAPVVVDEQVLVGSRCGRMAPALRLLAEGRVPVEALVEARMPVHDAEAALRRAGTAGTLKVLLDVAPR